MANDDGYPSLYSALYEAMMNPRLIDDLLRHPEFIRRSAHLCREIAGPEGGEELLQATCRRMLERTSQLDPNSIRGEGEFFRWFARLARQVHLSNLLSEAASESCTEAGRWPASSAEVKRDEVGRFLAHADACPYHTRILREEQEALRAAFGKARGLDSQGRILLGDELQERVAEHEQELKNWRQSAFKKGEPFGHVALFNGGKEVASCGKFYDFTIHQSVNELDPQAGLQIYGVSGSNSDESVQLGFYALAGVRHEGVEQTLKLDNGYTVGLRVWARGETTFELHFRCVETKKLEAERDRSEDGSVLNTEKPNWFLLLAQRAVAVGAPICVVACLFLLLGKAWGQSEVIIIDSLPLLTDVAPVQEESTQLARNAGQGLMTQVAATPPAPQPAAQTTRELGQALRLRKSAHEHLQNSNRAALLRELAAVASNRYYQAAATSGGARRKPNDKVMLESAAGELVGGGYSGSQVRSLNQVSTFRLLASEGGGYPSVNSALHSTTDYLLGKKLGGALERESLTVMRLAEQSQLTARYDVTWEVDTDPNATGRSIVVKLKAHIARGGEKIFHKTLSYKGEGDNLNDAYDNAIAKAVKPVVKHLRGESGAGLSASVMVVGSLGLELIALPAEHLIVEQKDAAAQLDRVQSDRPGLNTAECDLFTKQAF